MPASEVVTSVSPLISGPRETPSEPRDCRPAEELLALYKGLVEVSTLINAITDYNELLTEIMEVARRVMRAEGSALILLNERTDQLRTRRRPLGHGRGAHRAPAGAAPGSIAGWVFEHGESALVPDAYADPRFYPRRGPQDRLAHPLDPLRAALPPRASPSACCRCVNAMGEGPAEFRSRRSGGARSVRQPRRHGHRKAALPRRATPPGAVRAGVDHRHRNPAKLSAGRACPSRRTSRSPRSYRPALDVGGDFYDVFEVGPDEVYFVIGDVAGKGVPAALLMAQSLSMLRLIIVPGLGPGGGADALEPDALPPVVAGVVRHGGAGPDRAVAAGTVEIGSAGHCPPWLVRGRRTRGSRGNDGGRRSAAGACCLRRPTGRAFCRWRPATGSCSTRTG